MALFDKEIDALTLAPQPLLNALQALEKLKPGQILKITTYSAKTARTFELFCQQLGHKLMEIVDWNDEHTLMVKKAYLKHARICLVK